jgi:hypothetical protein
MPIVLSTYPIRMQEVNVVIPRQAISTLRGSISEIEILQQLRLFPAGSPHDQPNYTNNEPHQNSPVGSMS